MAVASGAVNDAVGRRPYFSEAPDPLPLIKLGRLFGDIPVTVWGVLGTGVVVAWLANLMLTAGAVDVLAPERKRPIKVIRTIFNTGSRRLWAYLRVAILAVVCVAVGGRLLVMIFERLGTYGELAGWTGKMRTLTLPVTRGVLLILWASWVGVFAWWCRVIVVADGRRYVRRIIPLVLRLWWRRPVRALGFHLFLSLAVLLLSAIVLVAWRQSSAGSGGWIILWLVVLMLQAFVWHWRLRACRLVWQAPDLADLRDRPDTPWHIIRRVRQRLRRKRQRPIATGDGDDAPPVPLSKEGQTDKLFLASP